MTKTKTEAKRAETRKARKAKTVTPGLLTQKPWRKESRDMECINLCMEEVAAQAEADVAQAKADVAQAKADVAQAKAKAASAAVDIADANIKAAALEAALKNYCYCSSCEKPKRNEGGSYGCFDDGCLGPP